MSFSQDQIAEACEQLQDYCLSEAQTQELAERVLSDLGYVPNQDEEPENCDSAIYSEILDSFMRKIGRGDAEI